MAQTRQQFFIQALKGQIAKQLVFKQQRINKFNLVAGFIFTTLGIAGLFIIA